MKNKKEYMIIFVTVAALLMDILGREFAVKFVLPVWTDSIGTFLVAYLYGPVCGAFVGFTNNIIYGIFVEQELIYCIVGSMLGIIVGIYSKKLPAHTTRLPHGSCGSHAPDRSSPASGG